MFYLQWSVGILLFVSVFLNGASVFSAWRFLRKRSAYKRELPFKPPVSVMIPVCGIEEGGVEHFMQFCRLDWPQYQVIFTVLDDSDPAIPLIRQISSSSNCKVDLQIGGNVSGMNRKVRNLLNALPLVQHEWIVLCDADVKPIPSFLEDLMTPFFKTNEHSGIHVNHEVGLVHSLYRHLHEPTLASSWENVWINCDFWVQALLGEWLTKTRFAFGAAIAIHRNVLSQMGGLEIIRDYLADDYQLGNRVAKLGKRVVFNQEFVTLQAKPQSWGESWKHLMRWSRTVRVCQPAGFAGVIVMNMTLFAMLAILIDIKLFLPWSLGALFLRFFWANQCRNWITDRSGLWSHWWLILFKDLVQIPIWILAFRNKSVEWRGVSYQLGAGGKLKEIHGSSSMVLR